MVKDIPVPRELRGAVQYPDWPPTNRSVDTRSAGERANLEAREYPELQDQPDPQAVDDGPEVEDWSPSLAAKRGDWVQVVFSRNNVLPRWQLGRMSFPARLVQYPRGVGDCLRVETVDGVVLDLNGNSNEFVAIVHGDQQGERA